jgi:tetratricopeptide (TPR) repeat protein
LNAPYPRLRNLGWISRYVKDLNACVGLTVEGALLYLLGKRLKNQEPPIELSALKELLRSGSKIQKAGVGNYLEQLALQGDLSLICELIDSGEEFIDVCTTPIVLYLKTLGVKETLDILLQNYTENDWLVLLKINKVLEELALHPLRKELAIDALSRSDFSTKAAIQYGLKAIPLLDRNLGIAFLSAIDKSGIQNESNSEILDSFGEIFVHFAEYDKALDFYERCLDIRNKTLGTMHPDVAYSINSIGNVLRRKGEYDKALVFFQKGLEIRILLYGAEHLSVAKSKNNIANALSDLGNLEKALEMYQQSLDILLKTLGAEHPLVAISNNNIGILWDHKSEYDKALEFFQKSLTTKLKTFGEEHPSVSNTCNNIGEIYCKKREYHKAIEFFKKSLSIKLKTLGSEHPSSILTRNNLEKVLKQIG